jgi:ATP synthase F1 epsilon subunit
MATIQVDIVSAEGEIFSGEAAMVFVPAVMGDIGIAPRHAPLITNLKPGEVRVQLPSGEEQHIYVSGGALEVQPHLVTVLADTASTFFCSITNALGGMNSTMATLTVLPDTTRPTISTVGPSHWVMMSSLPVILCNGMKLEIG